jgi:hypothetical protein
MNFLESFVLTDRTPLQALLSTDTNRGEAAWWLVGLIAIQLKVKRTWGMDLTQIGIIHYLRIDAWMLLCQAGG